MLIICYWNKTLLSANYHMRDALKDITCRQHLSWWQKLVNKNKQQHINKKVDVFNKILWKSKFKFLYKKWFQLKKMYKNVGINLYFMLLVFFILKYIFWCFAKVITILCHCVQMCLISCNFKFYLKSNFY